MQHHHPAQAEPVGFAGEKAVGKRIQRAQHFRVREECEDSAQVHRLNEVVDGAQAAVVGCSAAEVPI